MINFPDTPSLDDTFTAGGRTWQWSGSRWLTVNGDGVQGPAGPAGPAPAGTGFVFVQDGALVTPFTDLDAGTF